MVIRFQVDAEIARRSTPCTRSIKAAPLFGGSNLTAKQEFCQLVTGRPKSVPFLTGCSPKSGSQPLVNAVAPFGSSWDEVVRRHSAGVYRLALRLTGNPHDAEDLTQDVIVRAFQRLSSCSINAFEHRLSCLTKRLFREQVRRTQGIQSEALDEGNGELFADSDADPAHAFDDRMLDSDVQRALDTLATDLWVVVVLSVINGLSLEQISSFLTISPDVVHSRIRSGRVQLQVALVHRAQPTSGTDLSNDQFGRSR